MLCKALLLLDKKNPTLNDLYEKICSLSYMGDSRKKFKAEDPNKIKKLASGSREHFDKEYRDKTDLFEVEKGEYIKIDYKKVFNMIGKLPLELKMKIIDSIGDKLIFDSREEIKQAIEDYLTTIIKESSCRSI